ncbi:MAG: patatin-like phospholipase family protein [Acidobacteria bacterium]|nr:patatin-like phospholipase family protein [Candidatus Sulfomarinibacter kjeldsenii]
MGAVVGGMYLAYGSAARATDLWREALKNELIPSVRPMGRVPDADTKEHPLIQVARRIRNRVVISFAMNKGTVLDDSALVEALEFLIPDLQFSDLPKPLVVVATNLETGAEERLRSGPIRPAMVATSAIPGMVPAVEIDGRPLVDGGVVAEEGGRSRSRHHDADSDDDRPPPASTSAPVGDPGYPAGGW